MLDKLLSYCRFGPWTIPIFRWRPSLGLLVLILFLSALRAVAIVIALSGRGRPPPLLGPFFSQLSGAVGVWLAMPVALFMVAQVPRPKAGWIAFTAMHLLGFLVFSLVQTNVMFAIWALVGPWLGHGGWPQSWLTAASWEMQQNLIVYGALTALIALLVAWEHARQTELNAARLDAEVAKSRLEALTSRVDPHFLFNTLNTVSQEMFRDPTVAEKLLANLGEILRATMERSGPTWPLREECAHVRRYLEILSARFGERVLLHLPEPATNGELQVPRFSLQTVIENSVKHNADRLLPLRITVAFHTELRGLRIAVDDDGAGFSVSSLPPGRGLDRLAETLRLLFGARNLSWGPSEEGGAHVDFWIEASHAST